MLHRLLAAIITILIALYFFLFILPTSASGTPALGIHILQPEEMEKAIELFGKKEPLQFEGLSLTQDQPILRETHYITIPFPLDDLKKDNSRDRWQKFFNLCQTNQIIPLVRLTSTFDLANGVWRVPTRQDIIDSIAFLNQLSWPQPDKKHLIVFNEVNHHKEWGGESNANSYVNTLRFTSNWAHSLNSNFFILPSALDLAAPNGGDTTEAFNYYQQMIDSDPDIFSYIDGWNSHSYPNPAFSSPPLSNGKNSLRGYQHERDWLKEKIGAEQAAQLPIYITETGWQENSSTQSKLNQYYQTAYDKIWRDDPQLVAITPFLLQGDPGPFSRFSMIDREGNHTRQFDAFRNIIDQSQAAYQAQALEKLLNGS